MIQFILSLFILKNIIFVVNLTIVLHNITFYSKFLHISAKRHIELYLKNHFCRLYKNLIHTECASLQYRPEFLVSYLILQMFFELPHNLNPALWIDNNLLDQLLFHILRQFFLFQKRHCLVCFPPGAML